MLKCHKPKQPTNQCIDRKIYILIFAYCACFKNVSDFIPSIFYLVFNFIHYIQCKIPPKNGRFAYDTKLHMLLSFQ